jgi:hypothetical protein
MSFSLSLPPDPFVLTLETTAFSVLKVYSSPNKLLLLLKKKKKERNPKQKVIFFWRRHSIGVSTMGLELAKQTL